MSQQFSILSPAVAKLVSNTGVQLQTADCASGRNNFEQLIFHAAVNTFCHRMGLSIPSGGGVPALGQIAEDVGHLMFSKGVKLGIEAVKPILEEIATLNTTILVKLAGKVVPKAEDLNLEQVRCAFVKVGDQVFLQAELRKGGSVLIDPVTRKEFGPRGFSFFKVYDSLSGSGRVVEFMMQDNNYTQQRYNLETGELTDDSQDFLRVLQASKGGIVDAFDTRAIDTSTSIIPSSFNPEGDILEIGNRRFILTSFGDERVKRHVFDLNTGKQLSPNRGINCHRMHGANGKIYFTYLVDPRIPVLSSSLISFELGSGATTTLNVPRDTKICDINHDTCGLYLNIKGRNTRSICNAITGQVVFQSMADDRVSDKLVKCNDDLYALVAFGANGVSKTVGVYNVSKGEVLLRDVYTFMPGAAIISSSHVLSPGAKSIYAVSKIQDSQGWQSTVLNVSTHTRFIFNGLIIGQQVQACLGRTYVTVVNGDKSATYDITDKNETQIGPDFNREEFAITACDGRVLQLRVPLDPKLPELWDLTTGKQILTGAKIHAIGDSFIVCEVDGLVYFVKGSDAD